MANQGINDGLKLLRKPDVLKLMLAYIVSYTGTAMMPIAMAFGVLNLTGSTKDAAIVIAAPTLATVFVLLYGGVLSDRTSRQKVIVCADLLAMFAQLLIAYCFLTDIASVPLLTGLMLVNGIAIALHAPASTGIVIQIVSREELQAANALLSTARNSALMIGAALAGILIYNFGVGITILIDAFSFLASAVLVFSLRPSAQIQSAAATVFEDLKLGWREFTRHRWLWVIVVQFSLVVAGLESLFGLIGPAVTRDFMRGEIDWSIIVSCFGGGTLVGGLIAMKLRPKYPMRFGTICVLLFSGEAIALSFTAPLLWVSIAAFISGATGQIFGVLWNTTLHQKIPQDVISRVSAYDHMGSIVLAPLGILAAGFLYESVGHRYTLWFIALSVILPTLLALCVRDVRMMTREP